MAHTPGEIKLILDQFEDPDAKLQALKLLVGEAPPVDPDLEAFGPWLEAEGLGDERLPPIPRAIDAILGLRQDDRIFATMAWALGYDDEEHLRRNPPRGPADPPHRFQLPGGALTNSCDEARVAWRVEALALAERVQGAWEAGFIGEADPSDAGNRETFQLAVVVAHAKTEPRKAS